MKPLLLAGALMLATIPGARAYDDGCHDFADDRKQYQRCLACVQQHDRCKACAEQHGQDDAALDRCMQGTPIRRTQTFWRMSKN
jgi:hypothetical protein